MSDGVTDSFNMYLFVSLQKSHPSFFPTCFFLLLFFASVFASFRRMVYLAGCVQWKAAHLLVKSTHTSACRTHPTAAVEIVSHTPHVMPNLFPFSLHIFTEHGAFSCCLLRTRKYFSVWHCVCKSDNKRRAHSFCPWAFCFVLFVFVLE